MEKILQLLNSNVLITFLGWLAWNIVLWRIDKDQYDEKGIDFPIVQYAKQSYDNWICSLVMVPIILWVGYQGLSIPGAFVGIDSSLEWSDLFYLGSGIFTELVIFAVKKYKASRK